MVNFPYPHTSEDIDDVISCHCIAAGFQMTVDRWQVLEKLSSLKLT